MLKARIEMEGIRPLLQHNSRLASPFDPYARRMKTITSKTKKTDADLMDLARLEFEGGMYFSDDVGPYIPETWLVAVLAKASFKTAKVSAATLKAALLPLDIEIPVVYDGPRTVEGLWGEGVGKSRFVDTQTVKIGQQRVVRVRPKFPEWSARTEVMFDETVFNTETLDDIVQATGFIGIGDYRPTYGMFEASLTAL